MTLRCSKQSKQKTTLIENRKADELYIVEQRNQVAKASAEHHAMFKSYIETWKAAEKQFEFEKLKDIQGIVKSEENEKFWEECSEIFNQLFELTWKVRRSLTDFIDLHFLGNRKLCSTSRSPTNRTAKAAVVSSLLVRKSVGTIYKPDRW
jgi:hypothetical protein